MVFFNFQFRIFLINDKCINKRRQKDKFYSWILLKVTSTNTMVIIFILLYFFVLDINIIISYYAFFMKMNNKILSQVRRKVKKKKYQIALANQSAPQSGKKFGSIEEVQSQGFIIKVLHWFGREQSSTNWPKNKTHHYYDPTICILGYYNF